METQFILKKLHKFNHSLKNTTMRDRVILLLAAIIASTVALAAGQTNEQAAGGQPAKMSWREFRRTMRGYKAFYEAGYGFVAPGNGEHYCFELEGIVWDEGYCPLFTCCDKLSFATSQGFQFNNFCYVGAGFGLDYYTSSRMKKASIPLFVDARVNILNKRVSPFFDFRFGGTIGDLEGFFFNMQLGLRVGLPKRHAVYAAAEISRIADFGYKF